MLWCEAVRIPVALLQLPAVKGMCLGVDLAARMHPALLLSLLLLLSVLLCGSKGERVLPAAPCLPLCKLPAHARAEPPMWAMCWHLRHKERGETHCLALRTHASIKLPGVATC
jgi:hypothetical protein